MIQLLIAAGIPSALMGLGIWLIQRKINRRDAEVAKRLEDQNHRQEQREKNLEKLMMLIINTNRANNVLTTATARAVQRIPDAQCNGDMTRALEQATEIQKKEKDFLIDLGIQHIFEE